MKRLMARLDLVKYNVPAPLEDKCVGVKSVKIPLRQHIGAPARGGSERRGRRQARADDRRTCERAERGDPRLDLRQSARSERELHNY